MDTGATLSLISEATCNMLRIIPNSLDTISISQLKGEVKSLGSVTIFLTIANCTKPFLFHVIRNFRHAVLLGLDIDRDFDLSLSLRNRQAFLNCSPEAFKAPCEALHAFSQIIEKIDNSSIEPMLNLSTEAISNSSYGEIHAKRTQKTPLRVERLWGPGTPSGAKEDLGPLSSSSSLTLATINHDPSYVSSHPGKTLMEKTLSPAMLPLFDCKNQSAFRALLNEYQDVFAKDDDDLGLINIEQHRIRVPAEQPPIFRRQYRLSQADNDEIRQHVAILLAHGKVRESTSPWNAPVFLVPKKDKGRRMVNNYKELNKVTLDEGQPIPLILDVVDRIKGATRITTLDIAWAFHQVPVHPDDIPKTGFSTIDGHYEYLVMPFGLKGAPWTFQRIIQKALGKLLYQCVIAYLDDLIIYSISDEQHLIDLQAVFQALREANIKLRLEKCSFGQKEVQYLGYIINGESIRPAPQKLQAVAEFEQPRNPIEVLRFLGLCNYFRRFVKNFAETAYPLTQLTRHDVDFKWSQEAEASFQSLKASLASTVQLHIYDPRLPTELHCDASSVGIGAILVQRGPNNEPFPIAFFS